MEKIDIAQIKKKSISGIVALTSRTFILQIIAFGATFLLTIFLTPQIFGIFYVVSAIINFLSYFSDIGLAAALIQKKEELTDEDLVTTFTIQQLLVGSVVIIAFVFSQQIQKFYGLDIHGLWLLRALIVSFFLSSLKTIPSVLLERKLEFQKLVIPQILETLGFYGVATILAWKGMGLTSFSFAVITRAVVGLVSIYMISPWRITLGYTPSVARRLLRFGLPFQLNSFLALLKDDLLTVFLGKILPFAQLGYIGWAKKWAEVPLRLVLDSVVRVTFPTFARLQESKEYLRKALEKTLFGISFAMFPVTIGLLFFVGPIISFIPKYGKWEPALLSFYILCISSAVAGLNTPLTNALNAIGKIKITLYLMIFWTILTWVSVIGLVNVFGFNGVALALLTVSLTIVLVVHLVKNISDFSFWASVGKPALGALVQGVWYFLTIGFAAGSPLLLIGDGLVGAILYMAILFYLEKDRINNLIANFRS